MARPDVFQIDRVAILVFAQCILKQIDVEVAGERIGNDQWWRCKKIHLHEGVNATLKITIARQHTCADDIAFFDGCSDCRLQRS